MQSLRRASVLVGLGTFFSLAGLGGCSVEEPGAPAGSAGSAGTTASGGSGGASGGMVTAGTTSTAGTTAAGTASTAGATGTAGAGGSGTAGSGGGGGGSAGGSSSGKGLPGAKASTGCGKAATQPLEMFVNYKEKITPSALVTEKWQNREYWVRLPAGYDPNRPYPTVFVGPGCGGKGNNAIPIQKASGNDAIVVGIEPSNIKLSKTMGALKRASVSCVLPAYR